MPATAVSLDPSGHIIRATAAPLPGLGLAGYRDLERRANAAAADWQVVLVPPAGVVLPDVTITAGVIDNAALDAAGWVSARHDRMLVVDGGTSRQRMAVAEGVVARGGQATAGAAGGRLRLAWPPAETATPAP